MRHHGTHAFFWGSRTVARPVGSSDIGSVVDRAQFERARADFMKAVFFATLAFLSALITPSTAQNAVSRAAPVRVSVPRLNVSPQRGPIASSVGMRGYPTGPTLLPNPTVSTPSNDAITRQNAWNEYNAQLRSIPTTSNPNRLAARTDLLDQDRFVQAPTSSRRYNFQFTDNEVRSVQRALKIRGIYSGQVDGILGPDTRQAIETYQSRNGRPVTGQPDAGLNALLGIF